MTMASQRRDGGDEARKDRCERGRETLAWGEREKDAEMARFRESGVEGGSSTSTRHSTVQVAILVAARTSFCRLAGLGIMSDLD